MASTIGLSRRVARFLHRHHRRLLTVVALMAAWFAIHTAVLLYVGLHDDLRPADVGVVLGMGVEPDGTPTPSLQSRLDRAVAGYRAGLYPHILVSGSSAAGGYDEARDMGRYLVAQGIPRKVIIEDHEGRNTYLTVRHTRELLARRGWHSAAFISEYFHILRIRLACWRLGIRDERSEHSTSGGLWWNVRAVVREFVAYYWYLVRPMRRGRPSVGHAAQAAHGVVEGADHAL